MIISKTHIEPLLLEKFFQGESIALRREVERTIGVREVTNSMSDDQLHNIDLTPAFFRRRREQSERLRQREEARKARKEEDDLMLFARLIQKKFPSK